jgi:DNA-binding MarR family transcriptional regulator
VGDRRRGQGTDSAATPAGEVLAGSVGFLLSKLGFHSAGGFAAALEPLHINPGHFGLLRIVAASEGTSQQALVEELKIPASRMVGVIDELEGLGLVERRRNPTDRRANALYLTDAGNQVLERATEVATRWEECLCTGLSDAEREELLGLLRRLARDQDLPLGVHPGLVQRPPPGRDPPDR